MDIAEKAGRALQDRYPGKMLYYKGDITTAESWQEIGRLAQSEFGKVTTVVNNAGMSFEPKVSGVATLSSVYLNVQVQATNFFTLDLPMQPVHQHDMALYDKVFNLNVRPIFLSVQALVENMMKESGASFINISSTGYTRPRPGFAFYNASKAAVTVSHNYKASAVVA